MKLRVASKCHAKSRSVTLQLPQDKSSGLTGVHALLLLRKSPLGLFFNLHIFFRGYFLAVLVGVE